MKKTRILECTLRDGSYANNFQFDREETRKIAAELERLGFGLIEVGHGVGLGASDKGYGVAAETDETYLRVAAETIRRADWGMFCIPGIAELEHVDLAAEHGMSFIRIGTNVERYRDAQPFVERAKHHGMFVCTNFMKSYVIPPEEFAGYALESERYGADLIYLVDSAGGMFPQDVEAYIEAIRSRSDRLRIGFHGHDNLGMAVANCLRAVQLGADVVDSSLQGFGRSAGNASTEQLLCTLIRAGYELGIDPIAVMDAGERFIQPLITSRGLSSIDVVAGYAQFHSSYMPTIEKFATEYRVDPRRLIVEVCRKDRAEAGEDLVRGEAQKLASREVHGRWKALYPHYVGGEQEG